MTRPISTELAHIYVTGDNKKFLYLEDAKRHQETLERDELNEVITHCYRTDCSFGGSYGSRIGN